MLLWNLLQLWKGSLEKVLSYGEFGFIKKKIVENMRQLHVFLSYLNDKGFSLFLLIFFFDREGYLLCGAISLFGSLLVPLIFQLYKRNKNGKDIVISDNSVEMSTM